MEDGARAKLRIAEIPGEAARPTVTRGGLVDGSLALAPVLSEPNACERDSLNFAKSVLKSESAAILAQVDRLDARFLDALALVVELRGSLIVTGMGKAGLIGRKISATASSVGIPSHFLHPGEAYHGDLGTVCPNDVLLALSYSGETEEVKRILAPIAARGVPIIAIVSTAESALGRAANVALEIGRIDEADALKLAPSSSAAAMLAVGDALALAASRERGFRSEDFARFHPGGSLGRQLSRVDDCMRPIDQCRVACDSTTIRDVYVSCRKPGRRSGAILLVDADGRLSGIFTDSDLAKLFERRGDDLFDRPISDAMTRNPRVVRSGAYMSEALSLISARKISELPVLDAESRPLGMLDVTDLVDFFPKR